MPVITSYGLVHGDTVHPLAVHMAIIRRGGKYLGRNKTTWVGRGNLFHYKEAMKIIWPEFIQHRWFDLVLESWLEHKYIGIIGPKNSSKTSSMAVTHLFDYYCFPTNTTVLVCSTTKEMLENRIWGEIKKMHRLARERFRWLPGNLIEGRQRIVTDNRQDAGEGRDFRNGMCFPAGSLVDTPLGPTPIEQLEPGQLVLNALGACKVLETFTNTAPQLVRVTLSDGRQIDCTPEHPFLTHRGWIKAGGLRPLDAVFSAHEFLLNKFKGTQVASVEVLQQAGDPRYNRGSGYYSVHNLSVDGHPSYSVNGVLVHNCGIPLKKGGQFVGISDIIGIKNKRKRLCGDELQTVPKAFVDATANFVDDNDCKVTGMGNPAETTDSLGILCEPAPEIGGWESGLDQTPKTKTWRTRFSKGICVQLPGSDSPNMDTPPDQKPPYPFLMTRERMAEDMKTWGRDDWHYTMFNEGRMPRGQGTRRVITKQLCLKHRALEEPTWATHSRTVLSSLDAAYRGVGGDRCVYMELEFGEEATPPEEMAPAVVEAFINQPALKNSTRMILAVSFVAIIPIDAGPDKASAEDQIVAWVKRRHEERGIPPQNHFYDAGMRTSLVMAYSRMWSPTVNSIDCGGKPTDRKVSADIDVLCCDYYSKFVTELWYSTRLCVEAKQLRGLPEDVMEEGCKREWKTVAGNRIEIETKADMKEKTGRSPDLYDTFALGVEGARRLGFQIKRLSEINTDAAVRDDRWKREARDKARALAKARELNYDA